MSDETLQNSFLGSVLRRCQTAFQNTMSASPAPSFQVGWNRTKRIATNAMESLNNTVLPCFVRSGPVRTGLRQMTQKIVLDNVTETVVDSLQQTLESVLNTQYPTMLATATVAVPVGVLVLRRCYRKRNRASSTASEPAGGPVQPSLEMEDGPMMHNSSPKRQKLDGERTIGSSETADHQVTITVEEEDNKHGPGQAVSNNVGESKQLTEQSKMDDSSDQKSSDYLNNEAETASDAQPRITCQEPMTPCIIINESDNIPMREDACKSAGKESSVSQLVTAAVDDPSMIEDSPTSRDASSTTNQLHRIDNNGTKLDQELAGKPCLDQPHNQEICVRSSNLGNVTNAAKACSANQQPYLEITTPVAPRTHVSAVLGTKDKTVSSWPQRVTEISPILKVHQDAKPTTSSATITSQLDHRSSSSLWSETSFQSSQRWRTVPINNLIVTDKTGLPLAAPSYAPKKKKVYEMVSIQEYYVTQFYEDQEGCIVVLLCNNDQSIRSIQFEILYDFKVFMPAVHLKGVKEVGLHHSTFSSIRIPCADGFLLLNETCQNQT